MPGQGLEKDKYEKLEYKIETTEDPDYAKITFINYNGIKEVRYVTIEKVLELQKPLNDFMNRVI